MGSMFAPDRSMLDPDRPAASGRAPARRRGACPGLSAPMPTGDGLLVRLRPIGTVPLAAFGALCAAARNHGNGVIEITGRGSIQARGLSIASAPRFAAAVAALDVAADDGVAVLTGALAGLDAREAVDAEVLAGDVRATLARTAFAARLSGKISVVVDGGAALRLDEAAADVRLSATATDGGAVLGVAVAGDGQSATPVGVVAPAHGAAAVVRLLEVVAGCGRSARARDVLAAQGVGPFRAALAGLLLDAAFAPGPHRTADAVGAHRLRGGALAQGVGLAFGHADVARLDRLVAAAASSGAVGIRPAAGRTLMIVGFAPQAAAAFVAAAERLGFIVDPADPRRRVIACAGAPICSGGHIAARALAPLVAAAAAPHLAGAFHVHISGCDKGCARAGPAPLTVVGAPAGCAVIANGTARDRPFAAVAVEDLPVAVARYAAIVRREAGHV